VFIYNHSASYTLNKGVIIAIIIAVAIAVGVGITSSMNETIEKDDLPGVVEDSEPEHFTVTLEENVGFQDIPP